jgi:hypothetical protein
MTASHEAPGFAILAKDGNAPQVALEGDVIDPGVTLVQVLPKQARLLVNGRNETIDAPETSQASLTPAAPIDAANSSPPANVAASAPNPRIRPRRPRP